MKTLIVVALGSVLQFTAVVSQAAPLRPAAPDTATAWPDTTHGPTGEIQWKPRSHFREGAIAGGIIGGIGGAGFFVLIGAIANALSESRHDEVTPLGFVGLGVLGGAAGGAAGALVGGVIGSAFPKKPEDARATGNASATGIPTASPGGVSSETGAPSPKSVSTRSFGSMTLQPIMFGEKLGGGLQLSFLTQLSPAFHLGFEGSLLFSEPDIRTAGVVTRIYPARPAGFYFVGEAGVFSYRYSGFVDLPSGDVIPRTYTTSLFGGGFGAGLESTGNRLRFGVETRRRFSLQNIDEPGPFGFTQVGVTFRYLW